MQWGRCIKQCLQKSGLCIDSPRLFFFLERSPWWGIVAYRFFRLRYSPLLLDAVRSEPQPIDGVAERFRQVLSRFEVGGTYKTTDVGRTALLDTAIIRFAEGKTDLSLLDVGVSDGSASFALIEELPPKTLVTLTDKYPFFAVKKVMPFMSIFYDAEGVLYGTKVGPFFVRLFGERSCIRDVQDRISMLNPLSLRWNVDSLVQYDMFSRQPVGSFLIVKCANLLNQAYFSDSMIQKGISGLCRNLAVGGRLFVGQNHSMYEEGEAYFVVERTATGLEVVEEKNNHASRHLVEGIL